MSNRNDSSTRAFETVTVKNNISRQKIVIAIFVIIALIVLAFTTLIIGQVIKNAGTPDNPDVNKDLTYIPKEAGDYKLGSLLLVNEDFTYELSNDFSNMINLYEYQKAEKNDAYTHINGYTTYSLTYVSIALETNTLNAFNQMILDYCATLDLSGADKNSASNLVVAWGGYTESTKHEYKDDIANIGKDYYDHGLGTTLTLKSYEPSVVVTEEILKTDFNWIYQNAHKYGFIIRFPDSCKDHTGFDGSKRIHLRYVGVEHATYIHENNICLEKYLEQLRSSHSVNSPLTVAVGEKTYQIYYVKYNGNPTSVPVPKGSTYTISGDNMNGFIVSVEK